MVGCAGPIVRPIDGTLARRRPTIVTTFCQPHLATRRDPFLGGVAIRNPVNVHALAP
jgi:hypothetical protein